MVTGSVKVTALTVTAPVPLERPMVIDEKPSVKFAISVAVKSSAPVPPAPAMAIFLEVVNGCILTVPVL